MKHLRFDVRRTAAHALNHLAASDQGAARTAAAIGHEHVPRHLSGARVERHQVRVAQREIQLVVVERHATHRDVHAEALFPDQIARPSVDRLDDTAGVVQEDGAVLGERRRLVRAALVHRPDPLQLEVLSVVARDLRERAVARRVLIAPQHRPVTWRRIAQHLVGHGRQVLHLTANRESCRRRFLSPSSPLTCSRSLRTRAASCGRLRSGGWGSRALSWCCRRGGGCSSWSRSTNRDCGGWGERGGSRSDFVELKDVGNDVDVGRFRQPVRVVRRHRGLNEPEQVASRTRAPSTHEALACERRCTHEIRAMARSAAGFVRGLAGAGLFHRVRPARRLLTGEKHTRGNETRKGSNQEEILTNHRHYLARQNQEPKAESPKPRAQSLLEQPSPQRAAIGWDAFTGVQLDIEFALLQGFDLFRCQVGRP